MQANIIERTVEFVKASMETAEGGHDWFHIYRVWRAARSLGENEKADMLVVELAALLHDIADSKFHGGDETIGPARARQFLESEQVDENVIHQVENIIKNISFKGGNHQRLFHSLELDIVQDADRLDAMGAIGIARAFNYGGFTQRKLYDPAIQPNMTMNKEMYKSSDAPTINHFYEKLFLLKDRMKTTAGKRLAEERHRFMEIYIDQFYNEWEGRS